MKKTIVKIKVAKSIQSNLSNTDTEGTEQSVHIRELSVFESGVSITEVRFV